MCIKRFLICILVLLVMVLNLSAATWNVPGDFGTIQAAIDDVGTVAGDEIVVAPGTYIITSTLDFRGKAILLRSASGNPADTILDGQNNTYHIVQCISSEDPNTVLSGFTVTGGNADGTSPDNRGGGMYNELSSPTVNNCIFSNNIAAFGGAIYNNTASPIITDCVFIKNTANTGGGAIRNRISSSPTLTNCIFLGNSAVNSGGGIHNTDNCNPVLTQCLFSGNIANYGGGMLNNTNCNPTIVQCTFAKNLATSLGGGLHNTGDSISTAVNSILWDNTPDQIINFATLTISNSDIQGGLPAGATDGGGNLDADPLFVDPNGVDAISGTEDDNLRLQVGSPCIDTGNNTAIPAGLGTDLDGNIRISHGAVDMGGYEFQDEDGDGVENILDICPGFDDTLDSDGDGVPNGCDICPGSDDTQDSDGDGVPDGCDVCPGFDDTQDSDGDGVPDGCDVCPGSDDTLDSDGDGVPDGCDVCPGSNDTLDSDGDGVPDGCDICPGSDDNLDSDGDGIPDGCDLPIYVDASATGANNGSSWIDAYTQLQPALNQAVAGIDIWAAEGIYLPETEVDGTGSRYRTFQLKNDVVLYGGFPAGGSSNLADRNPLIYKTNLSGDLNQDDAPDFANRTDNSYHVIYHPAGLALDTRAVLDGFVISGGYADGPNPHNAGGGMYNNGSEPAMYNCFFSDNFAQIGGGVFNQSCSPSLETCVIANNAADVYGGGLTNIEASTNVTNCVFYANHANTSGGGLYNENLSYPQISNSIIWENTNNSSLDQIYNGLYSNPSIDYCDVQGGAGLGGIDQDPSFVDPTNGDFHLNYDSPCIDAGAFVGITVLTDIDGDNRIINDSVDIGIDEVDGFLLTINSEPFGAGSLSLDPDYKLYPADTVVTVSVASDTNYQFDHWTGELTGSDNPISVTMTKNKELTAYFSFIGDIIYVDDDSTAASPDGTSWGNAYPDLQQALDAAIPGNHIWVAKGTYYPSSLLDALDPRTAVYQMKNGVSIYGGFDGTEDRNVFDLSQRDFIANETILSGDIGASGFDFDNCYHVFYHRPKYDTLDGSALLDGFTVSNGNANNQTSGHDSGGGMYNSGYDSTCMPTIRNCTFTNNKAAVGGGMYNSYSSPTIIACTFSNNSAEAASDSVLRGGGGLYNSFSSSPKVTDCLIINNTVSGNNGFGGGMVNYGSCNPVITRCRIEGNTASYSGGISNHYQISATFTDCEIVDNAGQGLRTIESSSIFNRCLFEGNTYTQSGGAIRIEDGTPKFINCILSENTSNGSIIYTAGDSTMEPQFINCTIANNTNTWSYWGLTYNTGSGRPTYENCIMWDNIPNTIVDYGTAVSTINYCNIQGGFTDGIGNIDMDPNFVDAANGDFHLQMVSPCIDQGSNAAVPEAILTDFSGHSRFVDGNCDNINTVDMGAYEYSRRYQGDLNDDCNVNLLDLSVLSANWNTSTTEADVAIGYGDGIVNMNDLLVVAENWLTVW